MVKLQFDANSQFKVTLPKQVCLALGWKKGDVINISLDGDGNLVLKRCLRAAKEKGRKKKR